MPVFLLCYLAIAQAVGDTYRYTMLGRAVDKHGQPVPFAHVVIAPGPDNEGGDFIYSDNADAEGRIRFAVDDSNLIKITRLMYVTGPLPPNAVAAIKPPFDDYPVLAELDYTGRRILINKDSRVDIGNIPVQVFYGVVKVFLQDQFGKPLVREAAAWRYIWLRIRNEQRNMVIETSISREQIEQAVDVSQSSLAVALPEGTWYVEISPNEDKGPWLTTALPLAVQASNKQSQIILKLP